MVSKRSYLLLVSMSFFLLMGCTANRINIAVEKDSVAPGSSVAKHGQNLKL
jgi:uncharacterized protein YcfL